MTLNLSETQKTMSISLFATITRWLLLDWYTTSILSRSYFHCLSISVLAAVWFLLLFSQWGRLVEISVLQPFVKL